jgi:predicted transcriptional regulator
MAAVRDSEATARAAAIRKRIADRGLSIAEFGRLAGFSRNVTYAVLKGRKLRPHEIERVTSVLGAPP